jgi:hypothetical protein
MPHPTFDRSRLQLRPLGERTHDFTSDEIIPLDAAPPVFADPQLEALAARIVAARERGVPVVWSMGAHVLKVGLPLHLIDLIRRGWITALAVNGAVVIHDFEMALVGATTESVARYIRDGQFGLWEETGRINDLAAQAASEGIGFGEAVGREIATGDFQHKELSVLAAAYEAGVPATVHVGIGYDIIHEHPNCDGAALGAASYHDFLVFTEIINRLEGGVYLNYGTAVMGPEVYLKALAMARNVARQEGREIRRITTAVFDMIDLGDDLSTEAPKSDPRYYYRPFKTILVRTVADGGESFYIRGDHVATLPNLRKLLIES